MTKFDKINSEAIYELHYQEDMRAKGIPYQVSNLVIYTAISALEKQIPKKPLHWDDCEQFYIECPCCGKRYDSRLGYKGCPYCLQAIKLE